MSLQEETQWTSEKEELELMRNEEERQRTHEQWKKAVEISTVAFIARKRVLVQRQELVASLRLVGTTRVMAVSLSFLLT